MPDVNRLVKRLRNRKGFTLIELLVVISIIAILVTVIVATFGTTQQKARDGRRKTDLDAFKKALELHKGDTVGAAHYPDCTGNTGTAGGCLVDTNTDFDPALDPIYLKDYPQDPSFATNVHYWYGVTGCATAAPSQTCTDYVMYACLENPNDADGQASSSLPTSAFSNVCDGLSDTYYEITNP